jgi:hypothetical protein
MNPRFRITVGSEPDHDDLVGDLYFDDDIVCVITQDSGWESAEVEFFSQVGGTSWKFALQDFEDALAALKKRMLELRRA